MDCEASRKDAGKCGPGRPRDPAVEARILEITLQHLAEHGYSRMSLDAVAQAAGVGKPTIYRRWSNKADLATAALRTIQIAESPDITGSTVDDLTSIMTAFRRSLLRPNGMSLIGTVLAEEEHTPELLALFRERIVQPRRLMLQQVLEQAQQRGELRKGVDLEVTVNLLVGAYYARYLATSKVPPHWPRELVQIVWSGISR